VRRRLRIALVTEYYYPHFGGVCEHVHFLARELRRRGHHADIITSALGHRASDPNLVEIGHSLPVYANGSLARITVGVGLRRRLRDQLRQGRYDLVHVHSPLTPTLPLLAVDVAEVPVVGTIHTNFDRSLIYRLLRRRIQRSLDRLAAVVCVSPTAAAAHERYFRADWRIIPNGIDLDAFRPDVPVPPLLSDGAPSILFLGRFDPRNGLDTLIRAFRVLREIHPTARLIVVGDGPLWRHYHRLAGGDPRIHFVGGLRDERPGYYAHSTVYACPTTKASFGITLLEAMACATPIVCSDIAGFHDVVRDGHEALFVASGDALALAGALGRVLDDSALRARLAAGGRAHVAAYSWPRVTDEILALYDEVLGRAAPAESAAS
jgi:phosphatidylinositol alpha-mannosyltransferase